MLWVCGASRFKHLTPGSVFAIMAPPKAVEPAHHVLVFDTDSESFTCAGIVIAKDEGTSIEVAVFKTWHGDSMRRSDMFALIKPRTDVRDAPPRNTLPIPRPGLAIYALIDSEAFRAYAAALSVL